jgi:hypothetical protein
MSICWPGTKNNLKRFDVLTPPFNPLECRDNKICGTPKMSERTTKLVQWWSRMSQVLWSPENRLQKVMEKFCDILGIIFVTFKAQTLLKGWHGCRTKVKIKESNVLSELFRFFTTTYIYTTHLQMKKKMTIPLELLFFLKKILHVPTSNIPTYIF